MGLDLRRSTLAKVPTAPEIAQVAISVARRDQPRAAAVELGIGLGELEPEGHRLGVDAVAAADRRRELVLEGAPLQHREQRVEIGEQDVRGGSAAPRARCRARRSWSSPGGGSALGPELLGDQVRKAITSCLVSASIASIARMSMSPSTFGVVASRIRRVLGRDLRLGPSLRRRTLRFATRCDTGFRATRWRSFPGGNSGAPSSGRLAEAPPSIKSAGALASQSKSG